MYIISDVSMGLFFHMKMVSFLCKLYVVHDLNIFHYRCMKITTLMFMIYPHYVSFLMF